MLVDLEKGCSRSRGRLGIKPEPLSIAIALAAFQNARCHLNPFLKWLHLTVASHTWLSVTGFAAPTIPFSKVKEWTPRLFLYEPDGCLQAFVSGNPLAAA